MFCSNCGRELDDKAVICVGCGVPIAKKKETELPMSWYKFLINFALWAGAVVNFFNAIKLIASFGDEVYSYYPAILAIDAIQAISVIALGVLAIVTRFKLAKYRKDGPILLYMLYAGNAAFTLAFTVVSSIVAGYSLVSASTVISIIGAVVMVILNYIYFNKRKHMFIN